MSCVEQETASLASKRVIELVPGCKGESVEYREKMAIVVSIFCRRVPCELPDQGALQSIPGHGHGGQAVGGD